ncbi:hypothetical protein GCM10011415_10870 [Salipiger pallidus]|uniref:Uncharacterized protein n=1 Tax=Salipiger pallidus TaxID=1775170 RepID=A0A8J2ZHT1_9RHOB|nr:hypothetical protein [Salipiger pallidus]GGG65903.1 hypothetical protein GCM10011415_10870 [Salipiger pallidus]
MSAPDTNVKRQEKQHKAPLLGMWVGLGFVALLFVGWLFYVAADGSEEEQTPETGSTVEQTEEVSPTTSDSDNAQTTTAPAAEE